MIRFVTIVLFLSLYIGMYKSFAQYSWFIDFKGSNYVGADDLDVDPNNNVLQIGNFNDGVTIAGNSYSGRGSFLLKLSKNGMPIWHKIIRYGGGDFWGLSHVETDKEGNTYFAGTFPETASVDGVQLFNGTFSYHIMLAKVNPDGVMLWSKVIPNVQEIYDMKVNDAGSILLYSHHYASIDFNNVSLNVGSNSFGMLLSTEGDLLWAKTIGDPLQYTTWPKVCALDNSGNSYFHGIFTGTLSLDGKQGISTGGNFDYFFTQINPQGICNWITTAERKAPAAYEHPNPPNGLVIERGAMETDNAGNVYVGGNYWQGMTINNTTLTPQFTGPIDTHLFLLKLNSDGALEWARAPQVNSTHNTIDDIVIRNGFIYYSGIQFTQFYFSVYTPNGDAVEDAIMVPLYGDISSGLGVDAEDSVYMSGRTYQTSNVTGDFQGFVFKYKYSINPSPPDDAVIITEPPAYCAWESSVTASTIPIGGAESYEWEVFHNGQSTFFTTTTAELEISIVEMGLVDDFDVRVRGVNGYGKGEYSNLHTVKMENPPDNPQLAATCTDIYLEEPASQIRWYNNDQLMMEFDANQQRIVPESKGVYYVTTSNSCGSFVSNSINFGPVASESVSIPNIITPNNDGDNDFFFIDEKLESPTLSIFNRWGDQVYYSAQYVNEWSGEELSVGVYYFKLTSKCISKPIQGSLTVRK